MSEMQSQITTVGDLAAALAVCPPQTRVRLAVAPGYPQASTIGAIACSPDDVDHDGRGSELTASGWCGSANAARSATCPRSPAMRSVTVGCERRTPAVSTGISAPGSWSMPELACVAWGRLDHRRRLREVPALLDRGGCPPRVLSVWAC
jgi:hypothetical protein